MKRTDGQLPERLVRVAQANPEIDIEARTVRAVIMTNSLARDGGILLPDGIVTRFYEANPIVQAQHGLAASIHSPVIGRSLGLKATASGMESVTQFADTDLGREYGYLYGINPKREVYMRAWSFGWRTLDLEWISAGQAKEMLGAGWDQDAFDASPFERVWLAKRAEMHEYSAVAVGSDRLALSRAHAAGLRAAGDMLATIDLNEARDLIAALRMDVTNLKDEHARRMEKVEQDILALRRDGAAAAARGDTAGVLEGLQDLLRMVKGTNH